MTSVTNIRLRALPRFPANITGTNGIAVVRDGANLVVQPDFGSLAEIASIPNPAETLFLAWNRETGDYRTIPFQSMFENSGSAAGFATRLIAEVATISLAVHAIELYGDTTVGDGLGGLYIDIDNGSADTFVSGDGRTWYLAADVGEGRIVDSAVTTDKLNDDAVTTAKLDDDAVTADKLGPESVTDASLAAPANITYLNQTETTLDFYGGDAVEMFSVSPARKFSVGAANIEFGEAFTIPAGAQLNVENGAIFIPTFEPVGVDRATPLIDLGDGVHANYLKMQLDAGINTIRKGFRLGNNAQIGYIEVTSADINLNRIESGTTDLISGAVLIDGDHIRIGQMYLSRFDRGWTVIDSQDVIISKVRNLETLMGGYVHGTRDLHILAGLTTGASAAEATALSRPRGPMTPGLNSLVLAGCSDSSFSNWFSQDLLEHAVRVGAMAGGTPVPNHRLAFVNHQHYRPYGCGFKMDDGDAFNIKRVLIQGLYTEDVGHNNWFGDVGYQNWATSSGGDYVNTPGTDNDGNKAGCALRNSQYVTLQGYSNKTASYANSGYYGLWIESSNYVQGSNIDTEKARHDGVVIQSGATISPDRIELRGVATRENVDSGLLFEATPSNVNWRGVQVIGLDSQLNGGYGYEVTARLDGASPFVTLTSRIEGFVRANTAGPRSIAATVLVDADFVDDVKIPAASVVFDPPSLADGAGTTTTITVTGAELGDYAFASFSLALQGITVTAWVSATNTVSVRFQNESGGVLDLGSGTLRATIKRAQAA